MMKKIKNGKEKFFSLYLGDESLFDKIKNVSIKLKGKERDKIMQFSLIEIKRKKYLIGLNIINKKLIILYWEFFSLISGIIADYKSVGKKDNEIEAIISLENCLINYFYYCFEKYPLIGAIQYNFR